MKLKPNCLHFILHPSAFILPLMPAPLSLLQLLVREFERLDGDAVVGGVEGRASPLRRPRVEEVPAHLLVPGLVHQYDRAVLALRLPVENGLTPLPQLLGVCDAPLERDIGE